MARAVSSMWFPYKCDSKVTRMKTHQLVVEPKATNRVNCFYGRRGKETCKTCYAIRKKGQHVDSYNVVNGQLVIEPEAADRYNCFYGVGFGE